MSIMCGRMGHTVQKCWYWFDQDFLGVNNNVYTHAVSPASSTLYTAPIKYIQTGFLVPSAPPNATHARISSSATQSSQGVLGHSFVGTGSVFATASSPIPSSTPTTSVTTFGSSPALGDGAWYPDSGATHHIITHDSANLQSAVQYRR